MDLNHALDRKPVSSRRERDTALLEVAKGIRQVVEELSAQFVSSLTRSSRPKFPLWNVPHRRNPFFTGREDVLASLHNHFASSQTSYTLIQALSGLGGIGKTQLAIEYAYRYQHEYRAVFWIRADSRDLFYSDIASLADLLSFPEKNRVDEQALFASVKRWLQRQNKWLLLLDNLEDFTLVDLLISPQCSGHVLLTTRTQATGSLARALAIIQMTIDESALFLLRRAKILDKASNTDYTQATYIAQAVDGFPLALD